MKQALLILNLLLVAACAQDRIAKPDTLMSVEQMTHFHVDLALLSASSNYTKDYFIPMDSLYAYHRIDSITFAQSNTYYASKPKVYTKIFESVKTELQNMQRQDSIFELESPIGPE